jgi:predicted phage-related endonuclease
MRAYEFFVDRDVQQCGFINHPTILCAGASPDGLVGGDGLLELKCPNTATHIDTLLSGTIPDKYLKQMMFQMACTGRQWCDFASYDRRLPERMRLFVKRVERDDAMIADIELAVTQFLGELDDTVEALRNQYEPQKEAA